MKRIETREVAGGKWLALNQLVYQDRNGVQRTWESVARQNSAGAVAMICTLKPSNRLILVRQYRPPADRMVIEFPAGLINPGESAEETAVRELREETGYSGRVLRLLPPAFNSPGLTSEFIVLAVMEAEESEQGDLQTEFDESEDIETILVEKTNLSSYLVEAAARGDAMDGKLLSFALGIAGE